MAKRDMTDPFEQVICDVDAYGERIYRDNPEQYTLGKLHGIDHCLSILRRHQQAWREANAAQPAPVNKDAALCRMTYLTECSAAVRTGKYELATYLRDMVNDIERLFPNLKDHPLG